MSERAVTYYAEKTERAREEIVPFVLPTGLYVQADGEQPLSVRVNSHDERVAVIDRGLSRYTNALLKVILEASGTLDSPNERFRLGAPSRMTNVVHLTDIIEQLMGRRRPSHIGNIHSLAVRAVALDEFPKMVETYYNKVCQKLGGTSSIRSKNAAYFEVFGTLSAGRKIGPMACALGIRAEMGAHNRLHFFDSVREYSLAGVEAATDYWANDAAAQVSLAPATTKDSLAKPS